MELTVKQVFSAKLSLEARIVLFVIAGAKEKLGKKLSLQKLINTWPHDTLELNDALKELSAEDYLRGDVAKLEINLEKFGDTPYQKLSRSLYNRSVGATPTKTLLAYWDRLYAGVERLRPYPEKSRFSLMHKLARKWPKELLLKGINEYFSLWDKMCYAAKTEYPNIKHFCIYMGRKEKEFSTKSCELCGSKKPHFHCEKCCALNGKCKCEK